MDLEALAMAVDQLVRSPAAERRYGRLYAVPGRPRPRWREHSPGRGRERHRPAWYWNCSPKAKPARSPRK